MSSTHSGPATSAGRCGCCQTKYAKGDPVSDVIETRSVWIASHCRGAKEVK